MRLLLALLAVGVADSSLSAQATDSARLESARPVFSMGQPPQWRPFAAAFGTVSGHEPGAVTGLIGAQRPVLNPVTGLLAVSGEALGEAYAGQLTGGLRLLANVPAFGLSVGADWRPKTGNLATLLSFQTAVRRGGITGGGSMLRIDWLPARHQAVAIGLQLPVLQRLAGRTRPRHVTAIVPEASTNSMSKRRPIAVTDTVQAALEIVAATTRLVSAYTNLYTSSDQSTIDAALNRPFGRGFDTATGAYHAALATAFGAAAGDSKFGEMIATHARAAVLDNAILPYDGLFGQVKDDAPRALVAMLDRARVAFGAWVNDSTHMAGADRERVVEVFDRWRDMLLGLHNHLLAEWKDTRIVWLAPQLALTPEQYDEQAEVDDLIGRAVGRAFTNNNALAYLRTADLTVEIARSITAARKYHVLWTHDFTGRRPSGSLDDIAYTMVADAYLPALTAAVQRYDTSGAFPQYMILLDAFYYHGRAGDLWMNILENPLGASVRLRAGEEQQAAHIHERLSTLRMAVARSARLQREAAANGGDRWLARIVKVNVNVVLPSDFSFRSARNVPPIPFTPDNISRDHRKLVLYDLTETNPYAGELLAAGIGIGEHYASATWEDRGYRLRGPAALEARAAVRRMLALNGFREDQIPAALRIATGAVAPPDPAEARRNVARVLHVHNEPGFGVKRSSVARAMMYSLAPAGSVIIVPDPLWLSESWAGLLAGAAARGSTVAIIAPAKANAPSPEPPVIALERSVLSRLLAIRNHLATLPNESIGELYLGLYAAQAPVTDAARRLAEVREGLARAPWIRRLIPFDSAALAVLSRATARSATADNAATSKAQDEVPRPPQLHQKTQLIARPGAISALLRQPGWEAILAQTMRDQSQQTTRLADALGSPTPPADTAAVRAADARLQGYERSLSEADRKRLSFYFSLGSQNQDPRGIMQDGELSVIVSGFDASVGLVDLFYLMARTTWIDREVDIDRLVPAPSRFMARLAQLVRFAM